MGQVSNTGFQTDCPSLSCFLRASPRLTPLLDRRELGDARSPPEGAMNCQCVSFLPPPHSD